MLVSKNPTKNNGAIFDPVFHLVLENLTQQKNITVSMAEDLMCLKRMKVYGDDGAMLNIVECKLDYIINIKVYYNTANVQGCFSNIEHAETSEVSLSHTAHAEVVTKIQERSYKIVMLYQV